MKVAADTVVTIRYHVSTTDGAVVDPGEAPISYLHGGYDGIFALIEAALEGKGIEDSVSVELPPKDAFGEYDQDLVTVESTTLFSQPPKVGDQFERVSEDGTDARLYAVTEVSGDKVVVDGNHPLAGLTLVFAATVAEVRAAMAEEIVERHVAVQGGCSC